MSSGGNGSPVTSLYSDMKTLLAIEEKPMTRFYRYGRFVAALALVAALAGCVVVVPRHPEHVFYYY